MFCKLEQDGGKLEQDGAWFLDTVALIEWCGCAQERMFCSSGDRTLALPVLMQHRLSVSLFESAGFSSVIECAEHVCLETGCKEGLGSCMR